MNNTDNIVCKIPNYICKETNNRLVLYNKIYESADMRTFSIAIKSLLDSEATLLSAPINISFPDNRDKVYVDKDYNVYGTSSHAYYVDKTYVAKWERIYITYLIIVSIIVAIEIFTITATSFNLYTSLDVNLLSIVLLGIGAGVIRKYFSIISCYKERRLATEKCTLL